MSILDLDRVALDAAKRLSAAQPQAKFLGNVAQAAAPLMPFVSMIPGIGPLAAGADAAAIGLFGSHGGSGAQGGGGGMNPYLSALQTQALASGDQNVATNLMNMAYGKQNSALSNTLSQYQKLLSQYKDPSFSMLKNTQYVPLTGLQTVQSPQISSLWSGNASQVPQLSYNGGYSPYSLALLQSLTQPQINFNGYQGPGYGASASPGSAPGSTPPGPATPAAPGASTMPVARRMPTDNNLSGFGMYAMGAA